MLLVNGLVGAPLGIGEEYGWRGYLLPKLLPLGEVRATLLLGAIWGLWHLPAILIGLNYPGQPAWAAILVFSLNALLLSFPFTWVYLASGSSVLIVALMHSALNAVGDTFTTNAYMPDGNPLVTGGGGLITAALMFVLVLLFYGVFKRQVAAVAIVMSALALPCLGQPTNASAPVADHHAHLRSAADVEFFRAWLESKGMPVTEDDTKIGTAADLIAVMDAANVKKAAVLSTAYLYGTPGRPVKYEQGEYERVKAANDWVIREVGGYPGRLIAFCGVNPLRDYALREIARCKAIGFRGVKLHFTNSEVDLGNSEHIAKLGALFAEADRVRMAIVVHIRPKAETFDVKQADRLIRQVLAKAPNITIQIAHMAGWGGYDRLTDSVLQTFIRAIRAGRLNRNRIYFDLSGVVLPRRAYAAPPGSDLRFLADAQKNFSEWKSRLSLRIRQLGLSRVLFATDFPVTNQAEYSSLIQDELKLTRREVRRILSTTAPYW
ncbi:MAG: amidohydrolase family protein [Pyrinomonadaceae bacterium]